MYGENVKRFLSAGGLRFIKGLESVLKEREDYFRPWPIAAARSAFSSS